MKLEKLPPADLNGLIKDEIKERLIWTQFVRANNQFRFKEITPVLSCEKYDVVFYSGETESLFLADIKVRTINSDSYASTILEEHKYKALIQNSHIYSATPYFIVVFKNNRLALWNLDTVTLNKGNLKRPDNTNYIGNPEKVYTEKGHFLLPLKEAEIYTIPPPHTAHTNYDTWTLVVARKRYPDLNIE